MNPELAVLKLTLDRQEMDLDLELQEAVMKQLKRPNFSSTALSRWAIGIVQFIASANAQEREVYGEVGLTDEDQVVGLITGSSGERENFNDLSSSPPRKRVVPSWLYGSSRSSGVVIEKVEEARERVELAQENTNYNAGIIIEEEGGTCTPRRRRKSRVENEGNNRRSNTSYWKRNARKQNRNNGEDKRIGEEKWQSSRPPQNF